MAGVQPEGFGCEALEYPGNAPVLGKIGGGDFENL